jgi:5'-phosphate synthase pdxT subunit
MPAHLEGLDGLIIPGGESTTIGQVAERWGLLEPLRAFARAGRPVWGTCAGMIMLANDVLDGIPGQPLLGLMDIAVRRNAFGRQVDSFETDLEVPELDAVSTPGERGRPFRAVFIRAPSIESVGNGVEEVARLPDGTVVAARQDNVLATAFHPELSGDTRFHRYFLAMSRQRGT